MAGIGSADVGRSIYAPAQFRTMSGSNESLARPINMGVVSENWRQITRSSIPRADVSRYAQPSDWHNILDQYGNRAMEWDTEIFTAELMNEKNGMAFLSIVAPLMPMTEYHVTIKKRDLYMLPFDLMAVGGVPRKTGWRQEARTISMQHYKRYQSLELNYLMDVNFGRQAKNEILGILIAQARLTLMIQASLAVMGTAIEQSFARWRNDATNTARIIHDASEFFALCNAHPDDFIMKLYQIREPNRPYNRIVYPEQANGHVRSITRESASANGYHYGYDPQTEAIVEAIYVATKDAPAFTGGDGIATVFVPNPNYRYAANQGRSEVEATQTLRGYSTIGEVYFQPEIRSDGEYNPANTEMNDPVVHSQTDMRITHEKLEFSKHLDGCGLWNDRNGTLKKKAGEFGNGLTDLIDSYNKKTWTNKNEWDSYLMNPEYDNNQPHPDSIRERVPLQQTKFRGKTPFVTIKTTNGVSTLVPPRWILSLPDRALSDAFFLKAVRTIATYARANGFDESADLGDQAISIQNILQTILPDGGEWEGINTMENKEGRIDNRPTARPDYKSYLNVPWAAVAKKFGSHSDVTQHIETTGIRLRTPDEQALAHVPDGSLPAYVQTAVAVNAEITRANLPKAQQEAIAKGWQSFQKTLAECSGKTSARAVIDGALAHTQSGKSFGQLPANVFLSTRVRAGELPLDSSDLTMSTALRGAFADSPVDDAMDIDPPSKTPNAKAAFGVRLTDTLMTDGVTRTTYENYPILRERLSRFHVNLNVKRLETLVAMYLGLANFTLGNMKALNKRLGIQFFKLNYWRISQHYRMLHMVAMVGSPDTMVTGIHAPLVWPAMHGGEGYVDIFCSFFSAAMVGTPENFRHIPNVITDRLMATINVNCIRSNEELFSTNPHKASVWPEISPMDEHEVQTPTHVMNHEVHNPKDSFARNMRTKHSGSDLMISFAGQNFLTKQEYANRFGDPYEHSIMSLVAFRGHTLILNPNSGLYVPIPGDGPRGESNRNDTQAAKVWAGQAMRFADRPTWTVPT